MDDNTSPPAAYAVGPGKPPLETRWKPGQSGNPKGRPRIKSLKTMLIEAALVKPRPRYANDKIGEYPTKIEAAIGSMFDAASQGNDKARKQVLELWATVIGDDAPDACGTLESASADAAETGETSPCNAREIG